MLRRSDADAIASALARRLRARPVSPIASGLSSRRAVAAIASRVARRLAPRRSPIVASLSSRRAVAAITSRVARTLAVRRSPIVAALASRRTRAAIVSRVARRLAVPRSAVAASLASRVRPASGTASPLQIRSRSRTVSRMASVVANRLATEGTVRPRAQFSVDAVASAVTRRLRTNNQLGGFPVAAVASAVARRLSSGRNRSTSQALASSIATRFAQRATARGDLPVNREQDPRAGGGQG